jgi:hypothetical protein
MQGFNKDYSERPSGGRLYQRPNEVKICKKCGVPVGRNYKSCIECYNTIENLWSLDWKELIEKENILSGSDDEKLLAEVIVEEIDKHSWTIVDSAMKIVKCKICNNELGGGPIDCPDCKFAFENLWAYDSEAMNQVKMTYNEHALRVGRWVLRYPHRQKKNIVESWKFSMPIVLTGKLPSNEQAGFFKNVIDKNMFDLSSKVYQSFEEAYLDVIANTKK